MQHINRNVGTIFLELEIIHVIRVDIKLYLLTSHVLQDDEGSGSSGKSRGMTGRALGGIPAVIIGFYALLWDFSFYNMKCKFK